MSYLDEHEAVTGAIARASEPAPTEAVCPACVGVQTQECGDCCGDGDIDGEECEGDGLVVPA